MDRYRNSLMSAADGILATGADGSVQFMNHAAERLTGWMETDARGRPLSDVFSTEISATNSTVLIARNGSRHPISYSISEIPGDGGGDQGVVLVFREAAEELRLSDERQMTLELLGCLNADKKTEELIQTVTGLLQTWTGCEAVGVRLRRGDDYPYFETKGFPAEFVRAESHLCERDLAGRLVHDAEAHPVLACMCGVVLRRRTDASRPFFTPGGSFWSNCTSDLLATTAEADRQGATRNRCNSQGYESVALIPLRNGSETLGLLQVNDTKKGKFSPELLRFLESAADQIAIALSQRLAREALQESETHYRSLFENMLNGFAFCRMLFEKGEPSDFVYLDVNEAFEKLTGLKDVIGRKVSEIIPGIRESDPELMRIYARVAQGGPPERIETYLAALRMWFAISVYCPQPGHFVAIFDVITERKRAEAGRLLLASAIEQAAETIVITDAAGAIQYVNPAFEAVTGYSRQEVTGLNPRILKSGKQDDAFYRALWETISSGRPWKGRFVNRKKDGSFYTEDAIISPVFDGNGKIVNYVASKHDSTRELLLESQLFQAQKMESVGRLAGGVAHDFSNMLQVISSYVEYSMQDKGLTEQQRHNFQQIRTATKRSADLTSQLLAFARQQAVNPRILDLNEAVEATIRMLQRLIGEDIEIVWKPGKMNAHVKIDPTQLDQILANVSVNARDAIGGVGTLTIETEEVRVDETFCEMHVDCKPGNYVRLTVGDTGAGMSPEVQSHIFEPFYTTKPVGQGTGLGLATVYGIIRQNDGFVDVYSVLGHGTSFRFYFPAAGSAAEVTEADQPAASPQGGRETILLVEDEAAILKISKLILERLGYHVVSAGSPAEALKKAGEYNTTIDLLVTDVVMPQMNGRELARRISALHPHANCLFVSGYTTDVTGSRGMLDEGVHFLSKPFTTAQLAAKIREVLDGSARGQ
jgi:two-component system cell cycle sensor histidine kinase/response regulator CckA